MLLQQQESRVEVAKPEIFSGKIEEVSIFVNAAHLYIRMKMAEEAAATQVAWILSYIQEGIAEAWKDNLLDELVKGESEVESAEQLFAKIRNDFRETSEEERKIEQLRTIEQGGRTYNEYVQEFKKVARESSYERRCYRGTVNVLSGHPRWMFRKNSMEFFVGLQPYLYYYYSGCTLESYGHMSFPECSMVT